MNEQRVELFIKDRKFSFMIPFNDYVPFKKAERKIIDLIENIEHTEEQLDDAIVYSALQLAIENEKLITKETDDKTQSDDEISQLINKIEIFLKETCTPGPHAALQKRRTLANESPVPSGRRLLGAESLSCKGEVKTHPGS